jgi:hypothetical protein
MCCSVARVCLLSRYHFQSFRYCLSPLFPFLSLFLYLSLSLYLSISLSLSL